MTACGAEQRHGSAAADSLPTPSSGLAVRYAVEAARPRTSFELTIPADGDAELRLLVPLGSSGGPLGTFGAPISSATREQLERIVEDGQLLTADPGENATAEGAGSIWLASPEGRAQLGLATDSAAVARLRSALDPIVSEVARHPVAAVEARLRAEPGPDGLSPIVELVHVGARPLSLVLVEKDLVASVVVEGVAGRTPAPRSVLGGQPMRDLVAQGTVPGGVFELTADSSVVLPVGGTFGPGTRVVARVLCWIPGPGHARRSLELVVEGELSPTSPAAGHTPDGSAR